MPKWKSLVAEVLRSAGEKVRGEEREAQQEGNGVRRKSARGASTKGGPDEPQRRGEENPEGIGDGRPRQHEKSHQQPECRGGGECLPPGRLFTDADREPEGNCRDEDRLGHHEAVHSRDPLRPQEERTCGEKHGREERSEPGVRVRMEPPADHGRGPGHQRNRKDPRRHGGEPPGKHRIAREAPDGREDPRVHRSRAGADRDPRLPDGSARMNGTKRRNIASSPKMGRERRWMSDAAPAPIVESATAARATRVTTGAAPRSPARTRGKARA